MSRRNKNLNLDQLGNYTLELISEFDNFVIEPSDKCSKQGSQRKTVSQSDKTSEK
jgi:hypothetical protein